MSPIGRAYRFICDGCGKEEWICYEDAPPRGWSVIPVPLVDAIERTACSQLCTELVRKNLRKTAIAAIDAEIASTVSPQDYNPT